MDHRQSNEFNECDDFFAFQDILKKMRKIDDDIIYALNRTIPTRSFAGDKNLPTQQCEELWKSLCGSYDSRETTIKKCIEVSLRSVKQLRANAENDQNDNNLKRRLKKEQKKLHLLQNELSVEEVVKDRSTKVFQERCRPFFRPSELQPQ